MCCAACFTAPLPLRCFTPPRGNKAQPRISPLSPAAIPPPTYPQPTVGKESGIGRGCKWAFSGARPGHPSGYQPELTDYKLDTRDWTLVDIESDRYVGEQPCEECHWFVRSAPMWIDADSTIVFHTCRSGDEVWTLVPKEPSLCPLDIGGDAYDTDGLGRGCMNMYSFHVRCVCPEGYTRISADTPWVPAPFPRGPDCAHGSPGCRDARIPPPVCDVAFRRVPASSAADCALNPTLPAHYPPLPAAKPGTTSGPGAAPTAARGSGVSNTSLSRREEFF